VRTHRLRARHPVRQPRQRKRLRLRPPKLLRLLQRKPLRLLQRKRLLQKRLLHRPSNHRLTRA
jgi:hypothetical protein